MKTIDLNSWEEFGQQVELLRSFDPAVPLGDSLLRSNVLFRGQADAAWQLETTLERVTQGDEPVSWSLARYFDTMRRVRPAIAAHTGKQWEVPEVAEYDSWASDFNNVGSSQPWKAYEFMAYLRHHGFPSPLLDWSRSPFVAAFFAFQSAAGNSDRVAIFAYREHATGSKVFSSNRPLIVQLSEFVTTHSRHFRQQCSYTVCVEFDPKCFDYVPATNKQGGLLYANHEVVFQKPETPSQDQLWKLTLPRRLRRSVLDALNEYNLNAYSLFATEDSLIETLAASSHW
jgi:hypothetical protein